MFFHLFLKKIIHKIRVRILVAKSFILRYIAYVDQSYDLLYSLYSKITKI